jgi:polysaccharide biosynthesis/export protein
MFNTMKIKHKKSLKKYWSFSVLVMLLLLLLISCTPNRKLRYIQDKQSFGDELNLHRDQYKLKQGDILHIRTLSADPGTYDIFNLDENRQIYTRNNDVGDQMMYLYGYTIGLNGEIELPVIGKVSIAGLTMEEAHSILQERVAEYIVDATVAVKIVNFSVTVLGEVMQPGTFYIYDHDFTVFDAIGLAGDLTDYGNRKVHIVRRTDDGLKFARLDLTDRGLVSSELYLMQPNDLVYVEPMVSKRFGFAQFPFGVFFSAISTTLLLINFLR